MSLTPFCPQGLSVVVEHLNRMRDMSHLRVIHRGASFVERKSLESLRLTGGAGASSAPCTSPTTMPCGLLNHLAEESTLVVRHDARAQDVALVNTLGHLGVASCGSPRARIHPRSR